MTLSGAAEICHTSQYLAEIRYFEIPGAALEIIEQERLSIDWVA